MTLDLTLFIPHVHRWELSIVVRKVSMIFVGGVFGFHWKPDMQIHASLLLIALMVVAHLVAMPFAELTPRHHILHWIELHSGTMFFIGEDQGRISHANLTALSVLVVSGNALFTLYLAFVYLRAVYSESRKNRSDTEADLSPTAGTDANHEPEQTSFANPLVENSGVEMAVIDDRGVDDRGADDRGADDRGADDRGADQRQLSKRSNPTNLPDHWEAFQDQSTGQSYYYNHQTGESQWEPPV